MATVKGTENKMTISAAETMELDNGEETQCEVLPHQSHRIPENNLTVNQEICSNVIHGSSNGNSDMISEISNTIPHQIPEISSNRRRRKQTKPQRCNRVQHQLLQQPLLQQPLLQQPLLQQPLLQQPLLQQPLPNNDNSSATLAVGHADGDDRLSGADAEQDDIQPNKNFVERPQVETRDSLMQDKKPVKQGFHVKRLHRPFYLKESMGFIQSKAHQCLECGQRFALAHSLKKHISQNHNVKTHHCRFCGKQYRLTDSLRKHIKRDHKGEKYHCVKCDKYLSSKENLTQHLRIHTGEKPYHCLQCGAVFRYRHHLNDHIRIHNGIVETCKFCNKTYNRRDSLKKHMMKCHRGNRKGTSVADPMTDVKQIGKPQQKDADPNEEDSRQNRSESRVSQVGSPPTDRNESSDRQRRAPNKMFPCRKCSLYFPLRQTLLRHMQRRHKKIILACPICNQQYHLRDSLRKHVKSMHGVKLKDNRSTQDALRCHRLKQKLKSEIPDDRLMYDWNTLDSLDPESLTKIRAESHQQVASTNAKSANLPGVIRSRGHTLKIKLPTACLYCGKTYRLRDSLRKHMKRSHPGFQETGHTPGTKLSDTLATLLNPNTSELDHDVNKSTEIDNDNHSMYDEKSSSDITDRQLKIPQETDRLDEDGLSRADESSHPHPCPICAQQFPHQDALKKHIFCSHQPDALFQDLKLGGEVEEDIDGDQKEDDATLASSDIVVKKEPHHMNIDTTSFDYFKQDVVQSDRELANEGADRGDSQNVSEKGSISNTSFDQGVFTCNTCTLTCSSSQALETHASKHPTCPCCNKQYILRDSLRKHIKRTHLVYYDEMTSLRKQEKPAHPMGSVVTEQSSLSPGGWVCNACALIFDNEADLKHHARIHPTCPHCNKQYTLQGSMRKHIQRKHPEFYKLKSSPDDTEIQDSVPQVVGNSGQFLCTLCDMRFEHKRYLENHGKQHPCCPCCNKQFKGQDDVIQHIKMMHMAFYRLYRPDEEELEEAPDGESCLSDVEHINDLSGSSQLPRNNDNNSASEVSFMCAICKIVYDSEIDLTEHVRLHPTCPYCFKQYAIRNSLRKHINRLHHRPKATIPSGKACSSLVTKLLTCSVCSSTFETQIDLDTHEKRHPSCYYCAKMLDSKAALRLHMRNYHSDICDDLDEVNDEDDDGSDATETDQSNDKEMSQKADQNYQDQSYERTKSIKEETNYEDQSYQGPTDKEVTYCLGDKTMATKTDYNDPSNKELTNCKIEIQVPSDEKAIYENPTEMEFPDDSGEGAVSAADIERDSWQPKESSVKIKTEDSLCEVGLQTGQVKFKIGSDFAENSTKVFPGEAQREESLVNESEAGIKYVNPRDSHEGILQDGHIPGIISPNVTQEDITSATADMIFETDNDSSTISKPATEHEMGIDQNAIHDDKEIHNQRISFTCSACFLIFYDQESLDRHSKSHPTCKFCGKYYNFRDSLIKHMTRSHTVEYNKCKSTKYSPYKEPEYHMADEMKSDEHPCSVCFLVFDSNEALDSHKNSHPACRYCGKRYRLRGSLRKHVQRSHPDQYKMEKSVMRSSNADCLQDLVDEYDLNIKQDVAYIDVADKCSLINDRVESQISESNIDNVIDLHPATATMHDLINDGPIENHRYDASPTRQVFPCTFCLKMFDNKESLAWHSKVMHLACPYCNTTYHLADSLRKHIKRRHPEEKAKSNSELSQEFVVSRSGVIAAMPGAQAERPDRVSEMSHDNRDVSSMEMPVSVSSEENLVKEIQSDKVTVNPGDSYDGKLQDLRRSSIDDNNMRLKSEQPDGFPELPGIISHDVTQEHCTPVKADVRFRTDKESISSNLTIENGINQNVLHNDEEISKQHITFTCSASSLIFCDKESLDSHSKNHLMCPHCGKNYNLRDSLRKHMMRSHPVEFSKSKSTKHSLSKEPKYIADETKSDEHSCFVCFLVFESKEALDNHSSGHPTCPYCGKQYRLRGSLLKHIQRSHPD